MLTSLLACRSFSTPSAVTLRPQRVRELDYQAHDAYIRLFLRQTLAPSCKGFTKL
jgi:hypothetical protein